MNVIKITHFDTANGKGIRTVLWVAGCEHHCKGCHNQFTWDKNIGEPFSEQHKVDIWQSLQQPYIKGITFSGGDPLHPNNRETITQLAKEIKQDFPDKDIWCYTGYSWEEVSQWDIVNYFDVLVDGKFVAELKDLTLPYCGSRNQRVIDVQKSIRTNRIELY